ncbi:MAG: hypothetical protein ACYTBJ_18340 [Planctomycetota bacterium]|jgi:hypothetical protein
MTADMPKPDINHEKHERREKRRRTRAALKQLDADRRLAQTLFAVTQKSFARRLSAIQSACDHDWEAGIGPGRWCQVCGMTEV